MGDREPPSLGLDLLINVIYRSHCSVPWRRDERAEEYGLTRVCALRRNIDPMLTLKVIHVYSSAAGDCEMMSDRPQP